MSDQKNTNQCDKKDTNQKVKDAIDAIRKDPLIRPLVNARRKACLYLPDDHGQKEHEIRSDRVRAYIRDVFHVFSQYTDHLTRAEVELVQDQLINEAFSEALPSTEQGSDQIDKHPVMQATILFMKAKPEWAGLTRDLLQHFHAPEIKNEITGTLPNFTGQLTKAFKDLRQPLLVEGFQVDQGHTEKGSQTTIQRLSHAAADAADGVIPVLSDEASVGNHSSGNNIPLPDDTDARIRHESRIHQPVTNGVHHS